MGHRKVYYRRRRYASQNADMLSTLVNAVCMSTLPFFFYFFYPYFVFAYNVATCLKFLLATGPSVSFYHNKLPLGRPGALCELIILDIRALYKEHEAGSLLRLFFCVTIDFVVRGMFPSFLSGSRN